MIYYIIIDKKIIMILSEEEKQQFDSILNECKKNENDEKTTHYIHDNYKFPLFSSVKFELSKLYYIKEYEYMLYGKIIKSHFIISWGKCDTNKVIDNINENEMNKMEDE
jgi:hypothetical protein